MFPSPRRGGKAKKRGLSREQVPILVAADRGGETLSHTLPALNADSVKAVLEPVLARDALHIQTVNSRHSQIKGFLRARRGIATKYLDSYLRWFHLIELGDRPSPRACLEAAMTRPYLRFAN